jgi:hypothetical protein
MALVLLGEISSMATQSILGIVMNVAIPCMFNFDEANLKGKVNLVFGGLAAIPTFRSWLYVLKLKGRTNREIDTIFVARVPPRKISSHHLYETNAYELNVRSDALAIWVSCTCALAI